jgi:hypothetical protein
MVARSCREFAIAHGAQLPAERLLGNRDAEFLEYPLRQINQPPAHHTVHRRDRATLNHAGDGLPLSVIEFGRLTRRLAIEEAIRAPRVEAQDPVADDLEANPANLGRFGPSRPIVNRRQCQQPASLRPILALPCQNAKPGRIEVAPQRDRSRHDKPPRFAMLNLTRR